MGQGPISDEPFVLWTLPSSQPHDLKCEPNTENEIHFDWSQPLEIAPGVDINNYQYELHECAHSCNLKSKNVFVYSTFIFNPY